MTPAVLKRFCGYVAWYSHTNTHTHTRTHIIALIISCFLFAHKDLGLSHESLVLRKKRTGGGRVRERQRWREKQREICWLRSTIIQDFVFVGWLHAEIFSTIFSSLVPSFHLSFSLSSLFFLSGCHRNYIKQHVFSTFSLLLCPIFSVFFCFVSVFLQIHVKTEMFSPQIFSPVQKISTDKDRLLTALRQDISLPHSILLSVFVSISSLSFVKSLTVPALFFTPCLSSSLHPSLPSVTHLSLPFTNQYAGQQAVWQIVCCELHEKPLSIISVHYWIQSVVFSRVKWKDQGVQNVRRGESERRPAVHFSLSVTAQLQGGCNRSIVVLDVFTIWDNSADHRYCAQKNSCMKPTSNHRPSGMQRTDFSSIRNTFVSHTRIIDNTVTSRGVANTGASIVSIIFYIKTPQTCQGSLPLAVSSRADVCIEVSRHPSFRFLPPHHWNKHWIHRLQLFSPELRSTEHIVPLQLIPSSHDILHKLSPWLQVFLHPGSVFRCFCVYLCWNRSTAAV